MADLTPRTLVVSSTTGRYSLDHRDGPDLTSGQHLAILLDGKWVEGRIEHGPNGYYFTSPEGDRGLHIGMQVKRL